MVAMIASVFIMNPSNAVAQDEAPAGEKSLVKEEHSIKKATIYSAVLPGLGQAYNKKYWKIPIVYAGFGVMTWFIVTNVGEFRKFKEAYVYKANDETYPIDNDYIDRYTVDQLETGMDTYRRYRDISIIVTVLWYAINILDANVDAHFFDYDISDDLSLNMQPYQNFNPNPGIVSGIQPETGLRLTLKF
jgi:hypothetical protein